MENLGTKTQFQIQLSLKQPFQQSTEQSCDQTNGKYFNLKDVKFLKKTTGIVVKSNKCNQCDYASSRAGNLRTHLKSHSGEKSNKCKQCDYRSSNVSTLRRHFETHSGLKSNKCNQCDFASLRADVLRRHLKTHRREKSNKCNQCDFASSY